MKLTTKGRYAVTAMLDLALHGSQGPVSLADISARQEISLSYLEQLFSRLRRQHLVVSVRGAERRRARQGGDRLSQRACVDVTKLWATCGPLPNFCRRPNGVR